MAVRMDIDGADSELDECEKDDVPMFDIRGRYRAKVVDVKDGDTILFVMRYDGHLWKFMGRMDHYDTIPMRKQARNEQDFKRDVLLHLHKTLWDKTVELQCNGFDKYGNVLVEVYLGARNINQEMIDAKWGKPDRTNRKQPKRSDPQPDE